MSADLATFHSSKNELSDGSATFDVYASDAYGQTLIAEPASENSAFYLAEALSTLRTLFLNCGSDRDVARLVIAFDNFAAIQSRKAA